MDAQVTEQQVYEMLEEYPAFELRRYPDHFVGETEVGGPFELVSNRSRLSMTVRGGVGVR